MKTNNNIAKTHLEQIRALEKKKHHPVLHKIHKKYGISKRTLFYMKEYGAHSNVPKTIVKESIKILLLASLTSAFGGIAIERIKLLFAAVIPLVVLLPALNDLIGDYGSILSSRISTMLHEGKLKGNWRKNKELRKLFAQIIITALLMAVFSVLLSLVISKLSTGYSLNLEDAFKLLFIAFADIAILVTIICFVSIVAGIFYYKKREDPSNTLIPIATSVADFGNMIVLSLLFILVF